VREALAEATGFERGVPAGEHPAASSSEHPSSERSSSERRGVADELLEGLSSDQRRAVTSIASPLCVLAGAGTGKTRVLTRRIAYQLLTGRVAAEHVLALTFTRKAATELDKRLSQLGLREQITAGTFHAVAAAQLRRWWADRGRQAPTLLTAPGGLLQNLAGEQPVLRGIGSGELAAEIAWAQARSIEPAAYQEEVRTSGRTPPAPAPEMARLYGAYRRTKQLRGLVDFDDLLACCAEAIEQDPRFARAQHWRWRHLFVDEFQDLNPLQYRLLLAWVRGGAFLSVVGDPNQAIYGWNGADPGLLDELSSRWSETEVVHLDDNHRCSPQVVAAGVSVLGPRGRRLRSQRPDGPDPAVRVYGTDRAEAMGVAAEVADAHGAGLAWSRMAVLTRTNAQLRVIQSSFDDAGVPTEALRRAGLLDHPGVMAALPELRRQADRPVALAMADLRAAADDASGEVAAALLALSGLARDFRRMDQTATVGGFLAWLPAAAAREAPPHAASVCLSSFHRAKGLEWRAVWVCGLERGLVPLGRAVSKAAVDEERRLLYVALTRAEHELHCSWSASRQFDGQTVAREPSPWLEAIGSRAADSSRPAGEGARRWRLLLTEQAERLRASR
jgi:ATP-dependent DNA helicase UvrD/PcrA